VTLVGCCNPHPQAADSPSKYGQLVVNHFQVQKAQSHAYAQHNTYACSFLAI
jgi:hypothetical protein